MTTSQRRFGGRARMALGVTLIAAIAGAAWLTWRSQRDVLATDGLSVTFLDRDGQEIGVRGVGKRGAEAGPWAGRSPDYFLDWAADEARRLAQGITETTGKTETTFVARATLDRDLQNEAEIAVKRPSPNPARSTR